MPSVRLATGYRCQATGFARDSPLLRRAALACYDSTLSNRAVDNLFVSRLPQPEIRRSSAMFLLGRAPQTAPSHRAMLAESCTFLHATGVYRWHAPKTPLRGMSVVRVTARLPLHVIIYWGATVLYPSVVPASDLWRGLAPWHRAAHRLRESGGGGSHPCVPTWRRQWTTGSPFLDR